MSNFEFQKKQIIRKAGFTLVEMLVAMFVFTIVMTIATGAIFTIVSANKNSQALKSVLDNLNGALDYMSLNLRYGSVYHCGDPNANGGVTTPYSCPNGTGGNAVSFLSKDGIETEYKYDSTGNGSLQKCLGSNCVSLTAPEIHISDMHFYVSGAAYGGSDLYVQPQILMIVSGYAQNGTNKSTFEIETMVTQRNPVCKQNMIDQGVCLNP